MDCFICKNKLLSCDCSEIYFNISSSKANDLLNIDLLNTPKNYLLREHSKYKDIYVSTYYNIYIILYYYSTGMLSENFIPKSIKSIIITNYFSHDDELQVGKNIKNSTSTNNNVLILHPLFLTYFYGLEKTIKQWNRIVKKAYNSNYIFYYYNIFINKDLAKRLKNFDNWIFYPYAASELKIITEYWNWKKVFKKNWSFRMALLATYKKQKEPIDNDLLTTNELIEFNKENKDYLENILFNNFNNYETILDKKLIDVPLEKESDYHLLYILNKYKDEIFDDRFESYYKKYWYKFSYDFIYTYICNESFQIDIDDYLKHLSNNTKYFENYVEDKKLLCQKIPDDYAYFIAEKYPREYCEVSKNVSIIKKIAVNNELIFYSGRNSDINIIWVKDDLFYYKLGQISKSYNVPIYEVNNLNVEELFTFINTLDKEIIKDFSINYFNLRTLPFKKEEIKILMPWITKKLIFYHVIKQNYYNIIDVIMSDRRYDYLIKNTSLWIGYHDKIKKLILKNDRDDLLAFYSIKDIPLNILITNSSKKIINKLFESI